MSDKKDLKQAFYPETAFGGYTRIDGTVAFFTRIRFLIDSESTVLDVGCGRGAAKEKLERTSCTSVRILRGHCHRVIGIDVDPVGAENPFLDEFHLIQGDTWPIESDSVDLLYSDYVLEHIADPDAFFRECRRVVKIGGVVCFRTPNRWSYVSLISALIPNRAHAKVLSTMGTSRKEEDVFPTYYRANSRGKLTRLLSKHGFEGCVFPHSGPPGYFASSRLLYGLGVFVHRWTPGPLQTTLFVFARRVG